MSDQKTKEIVYNLLNDGIKLSEIQDVLKNEHQINMTFLDLRLLAAGLENVDWGQHEPEQEAEEDAQDAVPQSGDGETHIEVSKLARPGAIANGSVQFASGATADWLVTSMGQLSLENNIGEPTPEDIQDFQVKLQDALAQGRF